MLHLNQTERVSLLHPTQTERVSLLLLHLTQTERITLLHLTQVIILLHFISFTEIKSYLSQWKFSDSGDIWVCLVWFRRSQK